MGRPPNRQRVLRPATDLARNKGPSPRRAEPPPERYCGTDRNPGPMSATLEGHRARTVPLPLETRASVLDRVRRTLAQEAERVETADGVEAYYSDGVVRFRAMGTDPVCSITAESSSENRAETLLERSATLVNDLVRALASGDSAGDLWCAPE
jgi:hypothetical protein